MKKMFLLLFVLVSLGFSVNNPKVTNWVGYLDTAIISTVLDSGTVYYGRVFNLTEYEDCRMVNMVNDTDEAGFAGDSINYIWGYQTGAIILNALNVVDTAWDDRMVVDSTAAGDFGKDTLGVVDPTGTLTRLYKYSDTLNVTGYAYQSRWIIPEWDCLWRPWAMGIGGLMNKQSAPDLRFAIIRRNGSKID